MQGQPNKASHRVLISGAGSVGSRHARNLRALGIAQLAIADPDSNRCHMLSKELGAASYADMEQALDAFRPDIVFICTPTALHVPQAMLAAKHGAHLFIEKPLSHSLDGIKELEKVVQEKSLTTMIACNMRFHPGVKQVKEWLDEGRIGQPIAARVYARSYLPNWRREVPYKESYSADPVQGGAVLDCIHEIDLALWLFGKAEVVCSTCIQALSIGLSVDGLAEFLLHHKSGVLSSMHLSFIERTYRRGMTVIGTEGTIEWMIRVPPDLERSEENHPQAELFGPDGRLVERVGLDPAWDRNRMYLEEVRLFLSIIRQKKSSPAPVEIGRESLQIALKVRADCQ